MNASVAADECHKAVAMLVDKLDRMLSRRATYFKVRRHRDASRIADSAFT